jgi:hypothetical protein
MASLAGVVLIGAALVAWTFARPVPVVLPLGLVSFGLGWILLGAGSRPGESAALGMLFAVALYLGVGVVALIVWNAVFRSVEHVIFMAMNQPLDVLTFVVTWPAQFWGLVLDRLLL